MSANESYLNDHLTAEERAEREQIALEAEAEQMLVCAIHNDNDYNELLYGYELVFSNDEMAKMLRNLRAAKGGNISARMAILDCIAAFERRCIDCLEHQIKERK